MSATSRAAPDAWNVAGFPLFEFERRPRAILAADVVGYTRLMEAAELDTHQRFRGLRVGLIDPTIIAHRGSIVKNTGDGYIAVFETPLDAVRCACALQKHVRDQQVTVSAEQRLEFRMGIHWDPVIFDLDDVYGHGVNTAARLQEVAPPSGVVISSALWEAVADGDEFSVNDLGELRLKNLARPVQAFLVRTAGTARDTAFSLLLWPAGRAMLPSIAILPFSSAPGEGDDVYFAEGFIEDIITSLSSLRDILIVSRGSTLAFRKRAIDPVEVGAKLGVQYFVTGRFSRSGSKIRMRVELVDVATTSVLWAEKYDLGINEIFELQDEIAVQIVGHVAARIKQTEIKRALRKPPQSLNAYDYLLRALDMLYSLDIEKFGEAKTLLRKASEEDPDYAAPFAFAANWHLFNIAEGWSLDVDADAREVIRLANCAIERDPSNALAFAIQGQAKAMFFKEHDIALHYVDKATGMAPSNSWAWTFSSGPYGFVGRTEAAIAQAETAIRLSPIDPYAFLKLCFLAQNHYLKGDLEEAVRWARKSLSLNPRIGTAARILAASLIAAGRAEEAHAAAAYHNSALPRFRLSEYQGRCPFEGEAAPLYVQRLREAGISA